jgi:hypothetical protein
LAALGGDAAVLRNDYAGRKDVVTAPQLDLTVACVTIFFLRFSAPAGIHRLPSNGHVQQRKESANRLFHCRNRIDLLRSTGLAATTRQR